jgi:hypothetical protein
VVLLISSVSRDKYASLGGKALKELGLTVTLGHDRTVVERHIAGADQLVGLGKESGEIEYAADSVTVALSLPREGNERKVIFATAKQRAGQSGWCSLVFDGWRFSPDASRGKAVLEMLEDHKTTTPDPQATSTGPKAVRAPGYNPTDGNN